MGNVRSLEGRTLSMLQLHRHLGWLVALTPALAAGPAREAVAQVAPRSEAVNDGPYVRWTAANEAVVQWVCDGKAQSKAYQVKDHLSIPPACGDPRLEVVVNSEAPPAAPDIFDDVKRLLAVADIHGAYEEVCGLLIGTGVVNADLDWAWGDGHLLFCGDVFDRGDRVTESLWLIHKLERQAKQHGGRVHLVLGNHDIMPMQADLRYVHEKYIKVVCPQLKTEYQDLFGPKTELGRWLRTKPVMVRINDLLFVHGGLGSAVAALGLSLSEINDLMRRNIDTPKAVLRADDRLNLLFGKPGPLWYRGHFPNEEGYDPIDTDTLRKILQQFGARRIVTGHTGVQHVSLLHGGTVIGIHVWMSDKTDEEALLYEDGHLFRMSADGTRHRLR